MGDIGIMGKDGVPSGRIGGIMGKGRCYHVMGKESEGWVIWVSWGSVGDMGIVGKGVVPWGRIGGIMVTGKSVSGIIVWGRMGDIGIMGKCG